MDIDRSNLTKYETNKNDMTVRTLNRIIFRYTHHIIHHQIEIPKEYKDFFDNNGSEENLRAFFLAKLIIQSMNNTNQKTEKQHSSNKTKSKNAAKK